MSNGTNPEPSPAQPPRPALLAQATLDAQLPEAIAPRGRVGATRDEILITGGTGFFGRQLVHELLLATTSRLHLLVRGESAPAAEARVGTLLASLGLERGEWSERIHVHHGSPTAPQLGLYQHTYDLLAETIDHVMHCAAQVSWAQGYRGLRQTNVGGTLEAIRFACAGRPKSIGFISTIAAGFVEGGPTTVDETTPMLPHLGLMPLGYAQTKCVSEVLLEQAAARGLPVTVARASLLMGDTRQGRAATNDLTTALIEACVRKRRALDIDWLFECLPVDFAAKAFAALTLASEPGFRRWHLRASRPRHWREIVLWLGLMGHPVRLEPVPAWLERQFASRSDKVARLFPFRRFFVGLPGTIAGRRPFEIFLAAQRRVDCRQSEARLRALGVAEPQFDAGYLERCLGDFRVQGILPAPRRARRRQAATMKGAEPQLARAIARGLAAPELRVESVETLPMDGSAGFLAELAASRGGGPSLTRQRWTVRRRSGAPTESIDLVLKTKPGARVMQGLLAKVAGFATPELGRLFRRFPLMLGLARYQRREARVQGLLPPPLARHLPRQWAAWSEPGGRGFTLASEYLGETDWTGRLVPWSDHRLDRAIRIIAELQAPYLGGISSIAGSHWLAPPVTTGDAVAARPLWLALADFTDTILGSSTGRFLCRLVEGLEDWWPLLDALPQTLVHNDLNPRNIVWQAMRSGERPRIFDWELARLGAPQGDLIELLCFVLQPEADGETVLAWLERHRHWLETLSGRGLDPDIWLLGTRLALYRFGLERLPLYALAHHVRPAPFAPALAANWSHLLELIGPSLCRAFTARPGASSPSPPLETAA